MITDVFSRVNFHHEISRCFYLSSSTWLKLERSSRLFSFRIFLHFVAPRRLLIKIPALLFITIWVSLFLGTSGLAGFTVRRSDGSSVFALPSLACSCLSYWIPVFALFIQAAGSSLIQCYFCQEARPSIPGHVGILFISLKSRFQSVVGLLCQVGLGKGTAAVSLLSSLPSKAYDAKIIDRDHSLSRIFISSPQP